MKKDELKISPEEKRKNRRISSLFFIFVKERNRI